MNPGFDPTADALSEALRWTALRYVLGELPPAEVAAWELRLATEEACCAAVAEAAMLAANLQQAAAEEARARRDVIVPAAAVPQRFTRTSVGAALAALLATAAVTFVMIQSPRPTAEEERTARLVSLWRHNVSPVTAEVDDDLPHLGQDDQIPGWLLAAVSLEERTRHDHEDGERWEEN